MQERPQKNKLKRRPYIKTKPSNMDTRSQSTKAFNRFESRKKGGGGCWRIIVIMILLLPIVFFSSTVVRIFSLVGILWLIKSHMDCNKILNKKPKQHAAPGDDADGKK